VVYFLLHNIYKFSSYLTGSTILICSVHRNSDHRPQYSLSKAPPSLINLLLTASILNVTPSELYCIINRISRLYSMALNPMSSIFPLSFLLSSSIFISFPFIFLIYTSLHRFFHSSCFNAEHLYSQFCVFRKTLCNSVTIRTNANSTQFALVEICIKSYVLKHISMYYRASENITGHFDRYIYYSVVPFSNSVYLDNPLIPPFISVDLTKPPQL
jgi:hypothetical protein